MGPHSGKFAVIDSINTVRNWQINDQQSNPKAVASNTQNGTARRQGISSWAGSFNCYGHTPVVMPGEFFDFLGYTAPNDDAAGSAGTSYAGNAIVDSVVITWNWQNGDILSHVVNFSGNLALTVNDAEAAFEDATDPELHSICGTKIEYSTDDTTFYELKNITQATLTITAANQAYVNSSTVCGTGRRAGPIDWTLALNQQDTKRTGAAAAFVVLKNTDYAWKLYVDGTDFWKLKYGMVRDFTNITCDRESGAIIGRTINVEMNGLVGSTVGYITAPGAETNFWPIVPEE